MNNDRGFEILEDMGVWRSPTELAKHRAIIRCETERLVIAAPDGTVLTHWWLYALIEIPAPEGTARFTPDPNGPEYVEITDEYLITSLRKRLEHEPDTDHVSRRNWYPLYSQLAVGLAVLVVVLYLLSTQFLNSVPDYLVNTQKNAIGEGIFDALLRREGVERCSSIAGDASLTILKRRIANDFDGEFRVVRGIDSPSLVLPGNLLILNASLLFSFEDPHVIAGHVLLAMEQERENDSLIRFTDTLRPIESVRLVIGYDLEADVFDRFTDQIIEPSDVPVSLESLAQRFKQAGVLAKPFADAAAGSGFDGDGFLQVANFEGDLRAATVLGDADWLQLKNICR